MSRAAFTAAGSSTVEVWPAFGTSTQTAAGRNRPREVEIAESTSRSSLVAQFLEREAS